jgi:hypothetical protein
MGQSNGSNTTSSLKYERKCLDQNCETILCSDFIGELWDFPKCQECSEIELEISFPKFKFRSNRDKIIEKK